jgi:hypothetical protein
MVGAHPFPPPQRPHGPKVAGQRRKRQGRKDQHPALPAKALAHNMAQRKGQCPGKTRHQRHPGDCPACAQPQPPCQKGEQSLIDAARLRDEALAAIDSAPELCGQRLRDLAFKVVSRDN